MKSDCAFVGIYYPERSMVNRQNPATKRKTNPFIIIILYENNIYLKNGINHMHCYSGA